MTLGEVCFLTNDVVRLANFYKLLLGVDNGSDDIVHQTIIAEETMLAIYNDGTMRNNQNQNICIAFTCDDVDKEYDRLKQLKIEIIEGPKTRTWGARNMSFHDLDGNIIYLRSLLKTRE